MIILSLFKSVLENDRAPVVICDLNHIIVYMNKVAMNKYSKYGGENLIGKSLLDCHNQNSRDTIEKVISWFKESKDNNMIYTYKNQAEKRDVYMVALRDDEGELIGYYEKHEYRNTEEAKLYDYSNSLI